MKRLITIKINEKDEKELWVSCAYCNQNTCHNIMHSVSVKEEFRDADIELYEDYLTIQCNGCKTVSFCTQSTTSDDFFIENNGEPQWYTKTKLYPERITGRPAIKKDYLLPDTIYKIYHETHASLCGNKKILGSIGIRVIIESICKDQKSKGSNLHEKIDQLVKMEFITPQSAEILQSLRFMGNKAAHEVKIHDENSLLTAFGIVEHMLEEIYIIPTIAERIIKKK